MKGVEFVDPEAVGEEGVEEVCEGPKKGDSGEEAMGKGVLF